MKRALIFVAIIGCVSFGVVLHSELQAEDTKISASTGNLQTPMETVGVAPAGDYRPLTLWAMISLGSSYYTNPQRAQAIGLAYTYDGPEFSDDFRNLSIWKLAEDGKISFGLVNTQTGTVTVVPLVEFKQKFSIRSPSDLPAILARDDVRVVAGDKNLLGEVAKNTVVKNNLAKKN
jgi:hypothetical protein